MSTVLHRSPSAIVTIASRNYLPFALNALETARAHSERCDIFVVVADARQADDAGVPEWVNVIHADELGLADFRALCFKYDVVEFNTCIKPAALTLLLDRGYPKVLYVDPDTMCFSPMDEVWRLLDDRAVVLVPHVNAIGPRGALDDAAFLNNGTFNLGFVGFSDSAESRTLLAWWNARVTAQGFLDYERGLATDQKWANLFPAISPRTGILRHAGYDVAVWNLHERSLRYGEDGTILVNDVVPLVLYHFSGYRRDQPDLLHASLDLPLPREGVLRDLYRTYQERLERWHASVGTGAPYAYGTFDNGVGIAPFQRRLYAELPGTGQFGGDPFRADLSGGYYRWLDRHHLVVHAHAGGAVDSRSGTRRELPERTRRMLRALLLLATRCIGAHRTVRLMSMLHWITKTEHWAALLEMRDRSRTGDEG